MSITPEALEILLQLQGVPTYVGGMQSASDANDEFAASAKRAGAASNEQAASNEKMLGTAALINKTMKATGLVLVAGMIEGVKWSIEYNKQLELIHTQAGATQKEVNMFSGALVRLSESGKVKQQPQELAEALYHLVSMGLRGKQALDALTIAAQGAAVGNAHLEDVSSALGGAFFVGMKGAGNFQHVMGVLNATVGVGNMRMQELVTAFGSGILPVAKVAHIQIQDVGAALATLNDIGYSASKGANQLGTALHFLFDPTTKARKALEAIGVTQRQLVTEMEGPRGLGGALELIKKGLASLSHPEELERLGEILPGGRGKVLIVLMEQLDRMERKRKEIMANGGKFAGDVKSTMEQPANRISAAWAAFHAILIRVGEAIEKPGTTALIDFVKILGGAATLILAMTDHGKLLVPLILGMAGAWLLYKTVMIGVSIAQLAWGAIQAGMDAYIAAQAMGIEGLSAAWIGLSVAMDLAGFGLIILAITAVTIGVYMLIKHFNDVKNWVIHNWPIVAAVLLGPFVGIAAYVATHFAQIKSTISGVINWIKANWKKLGSDLAYPFEWLWGKITWVMNHIKSMLSSIPGAASGLLHGLVGSIPIIGGGLSSLLPHFAEGGTMPYSGLAVINERGPGETVWLPGGSTVTPSPAGGLYEPWAHTPNPAPYGEGMELNLTAYLMLPAGAGHTLFQLVCHEAAIAEARK